jgi:hypothetical protein
MRTLPLERHGLRWIQSEVPLAHLCLVGRLPVRLKVGNVEVLMVEAVKAENSGDVEAAEVFQRAAFDATRETVGAESPRRLLDAPAYEYAVLQSISSAIGSDARIAPEAIPNRGAVDAIVYEGPHGVAVEIRAGTSFRARDLIPRLDMAMREDVLALTAVLVVVQAENTDPALDLLRKAAASLTVPAQVVGWLPHTTADPITSALNELMRT